MWWWWLITHDDVDDIYIYIPIGLMLRVIVVVAVIVAASSWDVGPFSSVSFFVCIPSVDRCRVGTQESCVVRMSSEIANGTRQETPTHVVQ